MKVDGNEFVRNMALEQDRERLAQEQQKIEELKRASVQRDQDFMGASAQEETAYVDLSMGNETPVGPSKTPSREDNVEDILLATSTNTNSKKKYLMLGIGLILLFILTVLIIRLISNSDTEKTFEQKQQTVQTEVMKDDILNKIDSNEEYQKMLERKNALEAARQREEALEQEKLDQLAISKEQIDNVPLVLDIPKTVQPPKRDLFELNEEKTAKEVSKPVETLGETKKEIVVPPAKETNFTKKAVEAKGYFIQIGAFTREPGKVLIREIESKGYSHIVYKITIKGTNYNKVLIGPFKERIDALDKLSQIKFDFKNPNAYILKL